MMSAEDGKDGLVRKRRTWRGLLLLAALIFMNVTRETYGQVAVRGETVYTMSGKPLKDGVVLIRNGKIERIGTANRLPIPKEYRVLNAKVVTPGLIDAHSTVGLSGYLNQPHDQDQLERSAAMQPELRAMDAYNAREILIEWLRTHGVTTVHTGHGPGALISGGTMIVKTSGDTVEDATVVPEAMIASTLGESAYGQGGKAPGTRAKEIALLREEFIRAKDYASKMMGRGTTTSPVTAPPAQGVGGNPVNLTNQAIPARKSPRGVIGETGTTDTTPDQSTQTVTGAGGNPTSSVSPAQPSDKSRDLHLEALARVLRGEMPLLITANRAQDIISALRLAREFNISVVLDGAAESYLVIDEIKKAHVPVIVHPTMQRAAGETENLSMETAAVLRHAGIPIALQSGFEAYVPKTRVVLWEAGVAVANGLSFEEALATVTIDAARVLKIVDRVGSLEVGKDGDLALFDGDPFEYTTHVTGVIINGRVVSEAAQ